MKRTLLPPFVLAPRLVALMIGLTGRLVATTIGFVFVLVGGLLSLTVIGALIGVPLMAFGFPLNVRGLL